MQGSKKHTVARRGILTGGFLVLAALMPGPGEPSPAAPAQYGIGQIVSEHVRIRIPSSREWLARETIAELERCWQFMNTEAGGKLPRRIQVHVDWEGRETRADAGSGVIAIGMNRSEAAHDVRAWLMRSAAREMARIALLELSRGDTARAELSAMVDAMSEIFAHEFMRTTRSLTGAWVAAHFIDRIQPLGLAAFAAGGGGPEPRDFRAAAPGVTFLLTCRETYGREKTLRLLESLGKRGLAESILHVFGRIAAAVEHGWLRKVREFAVPQEFAVRGEEDLPILQRTVLVPETVRAGETLAVRLFLSDRQGNPLAVEAFVIDESSNRVVRARPGQDESGRHMIAELPIESGRPGGQYVLQATAIDAAGSIRSWRESYRTAP